MSLLVGASDSLEASDLLGLGVKIRADKVQHRVLVIAATDPKSYPQNNHKHPDYQPPIAQPHPTLTIIYGTVKIRWESASFISIESQENHIFRCHFNRPGEFDHQTEI